MSMPTNDDPNNKRHERAEHLLNRTNSKEAHNPARRREMRSEADYLRELFTKAGETQGLDALALVSDRLDEVVHIDRAAERISDALDALEWSESVSGARPSSRAQLIPAALAIVRGEL